MEKTFTGTPESGISYTGRVTGYTYQYDAYDRLSKLTCKTCSQSWDALYTYDANGNITGIAQGNTSATFTYNNANELIRENNGFTNKTVIYSYDLWGNLTQKATYTYTTESTPQNPTEVVTYSYSNTDWHDELTGLTTVTDAGTQTETITHDVNGNPLIYRGATLSWSGKQLTGYTKGTNTVTYTYGEDGLRLSKTVNGTQTSYYYNGTVLMSLTQETDTLLFSYDQSGNAVSVNYNGTEYYYLRNGQGDIVKIIDGNGSAVVEYTYNSWGKLLNCVGTLSTALGVLNPFRYRGYVYDEETELYYLQTRYYDPELCRFISADVLLSTGQGVIGCNAFAYCLNNPVSCFDDNGTDCRPVDPINPGGGSIAEALFIYSIGATVIATGASVYVKDVLNTEDLKTLEDTLSGFPITKCREAASALKNFLSKKQVDFNIAFIKFIGGKGFIWSDIANETISYNGIHVGIRINGYVYCNVHPSGLPQREWEDDFWGTGLKTVTYLGANEIISKLR